MAKKDFKADAMDVLEFGAPQNKEEPQIEKPQETKKKTDEPQGSKAAEQNAKAAKKPGRPKKGTVPTMRFTLLLSDTNNQYLEKIKRIEKLAGYEIINKILDEHRQANEPLLNEALKQLDQTLGAWKL